MTPRTKAVVAVDIFGYPCELDELRAICDRHGLALVEDAVRGARRALQGPAARLARPPGRLRVLSEQADDDRRGRRGHDRLRRGARAARLAPQPGPAGDVELAPARPASASTTGSTTSRPRSGSASSRSSTGSSRRAASVAARYARAARGRRRRAAARRRRRPRALVVRLRRQAAARRRPGRRDRAARRRGDRVRAVPAVDPPAAVHARAVRLRRGPASRSARTRAPARWRSRSTRGCRSRIRSGSSTRSAQPSSAAA